MDSTKVILILFLLQSLILGQQGLLDKANWALVEAGPYTSGENNVERVLNYDFEIMKTEVTNKQYIDFLNESLALGKIKFGNQIVYGYYEGDEIDPEDSTYGYNLYKYGNNSADILFDGEVFSIDSSFYDLPVIWVSWFGAHGFASHYGLRLPTNQEWEKSARGNTGWLYPWGNSEDYSRVNLYESGDPYETNGEYGDFFTPVGFYDGSIHVGYATKSDTSVYGVHDLIGNAMEWTSSIDSVTNFKMIAGGSCWFNWWPPSYYFSGANAHYGYGYTDGFRCARETNTVAVSNSEVYHHYELSLNYPNPFNPTTTINYSIAENGHVILRIYDILGREIKTIVNKYHLAGNHLIQFDAGDLTSGIYLYRLETKSFSKYRKMIVIK